MFVVVKTPTDICDCLAESIYPVDLFNYAVPATIIPAFVGGFIMLIVHA